MFRVWARDNDCFDNFLHYSASIVTNGQSTSRAHVPQFSTARRASYMSIVTLISKARRVSYSDQIQAGNAYVVLEGTIIHYVYFKQYVHSTRFGIRSKRKNWSLRIMIGTLVNHISMTVTKLTCLIRKRVVKRKIRPER